MARHEGSSAPPGTCPERKRLFDEYLAALERLQQGDEQYADLLLRANVSETLIAAIKLRIEENHRRVSETLNQFEDHIAEHGC